MSHAHDTDEPAAPRLDRRFRLQWEAAQQAYVLLYPEGMVRLSLSAAEILKRCDGRHSIAQIIDELTELCDGHPVGDDVRAFVEHAATRGWVRGPSAASAS